MRCFEQIRVDLCYQRLPVKLIGVGGGFSYGQMGLTHHALEDIALMRSLAGMTVIAPANRNETRTLIPQLVNLPGPVYVRLATYDEVPECAQTKNLTIGSACQYIDSDEYLVVTTGNVLDLGYGVCQALHGQGIVCGLASVPTIKPLDIHFFRAQKKLKAVFTIEEHSVIGGLGEAVARVVAEEFSHKIIFKAFGVPDCYPHCVGSRHYLRDAFGLNVTTITNKIRGLL
jgi:transketolase